MTRKYLLILVGLTLILGACVPLPAATPSANPLPAATAGRDAVEQPTGSPAADMVSGPATVDSVEVQVLTGTPPALLVIAQGYLADGCTSIDETAWVQEGNTFVVTITTVRPADMMCTQALVPFEETVMIEPEKALSPGTYTVEVNGVSTQVVL